MPNANRYLKDCIRLRTMTSGSYIIGKTLQTGMIPTLTITRSLARTLKVQIEIVPKAIQVMKNLSYPRKRNHHQKSNTYLSVAFFKMTAPKQRFVFSQSACNLSTKPKEVARFKSFSMKSFWKMLRLNY